MYSLVIKGGTIVTPLSAYSADVGIDGATVSAIGADLAGRNEIDASDKLVFPGVIDAHTHMALPVAGTRSSDDFYTGTVAAACGGITTIVDFTVGREGTSVPESIEQRLADAAPAVIDYALHGEVVGWRPGREWEVAEAARQGVTSFKFYTAYEASGRRTRPEALKWAFTALADLNAVAVVHCEDGGLIASIAARLSAVEFATMRTLADARPDLSERAAIAQVARTARETGCRTHIVHVSSRLGLQAVREGRTAGASVTAETCPQYLLLTRGVYDREDGHLFSASPPLRTAEDQRALWDGLRRRDLDLVTTDHCPFTRAQKAWCGDFRDLPYGLPGVETLLPLVFSEGVARGRLGLTDVARLLSEEPARVFGLHPKKGTLDVGSDADLVVFDPNYMWRISADGLHMNTDFSPYDGRDVTGKVVATVSRGEVVYRDGCVSAPRGRGAFVARRI
jgi:dihydropyrimidinase